MKNTKRKSRIGLSAAAGLLAVTGSIPPLTMATSCSQDKIIDSYIDKEYGVSKETYEDLKEQFRVEYGNKLAKVYDKKSEDYKKRMDALEFELSAIDDLINRNNGISYTALTNALIDFAREHHQKYPTGNATETEPYGIQLVRHTRTKWSDLNDAYAGMADSFKTYMHNNKMPASTINRIMVESKAKFDDLTKQLKATYGNDALSGLLKAKEQMITFFDEVNDDIALVAATLRLKDFMSEFIFEYKTYDQDGNIYIDNCIDKLQKDYPNDFVVGNILSNEMMNKIFTVTRKTSGQTIKFDAKSIVPGYTLLPKLYGITTNGFTNANLIYIDFGLVKNVYAQRYAKDSEKLDLVTAHNYAINSEEQFSLDSLSDDESLADMLRLTSITPMNFEARLTPDGERAALINAYFNPESEDGNISFKWDMNNQAYEAFFDNARQNKDGTWTGTLNTQSLTNAGLMISMNNSKFRSLSEINQHKMEDLKEALNWRIDTNFLNNCSILSDVNIVEGQQKIVTHNFYARYNNTLYNTDNEQGKAAAYPLKASEYENKCVDFKTSDAFYEKVNNKFNDVAHFVSSYDNSLIKLNKIKNASNGEEEEEEYLSLLEKEAFTSMFFKTVCLILQGITLIWTCWRISQMATGSGPYIGGITGNHSKKAVILICILTACVAGLQAWDYSIFVRYYYNKANEFVKDSREAKKEISQSTLMDMLKKDLTENFVLINKDGTYDKVKFASQKAKFDKNKMSDMLNMYRKYASIAQYDENGHNTDAQIAMKNFNKILDEYNVSPNTFKINFDDWSFLTGKWWWTSMAISIAAMFINIGIAYLAGKVIKKAQEKDDAEWKANRDAINAHRAEVIRTQEGFLKFNLLQDFMKGWFLKTARTSVAFRGGHTSYSCFLANKDQYYKECIDYAFDEHKITPQQKDLLKEAEPKNFYDTCFGKGFYDKANIYHGNDVAKGQWAANPQDREWYRLFREFFGFSTKNWPK